jgi:hypothetical protein
VCVYYCRTFYKAVRVGEEGIEPTRVAGPGARPHQAYIDLGLRTGGWWDWSVTGASVCVYYCRTFYKAVRVGEEESGGHVL